MKKSKFTEAQIVFALRQANTGTVVAEVCRKMGVSEATFYNWKKKYGGLGVPELRRLRQLEEKNQQPKSLLTDDVVMTIRGKSRLSGEHRGPDGVINLLSRLNELSGGTHKIMGTMAWMVHENHIHTVVAETATRNGKTLHYNRALVFEVHDGKIAMGQSFEDDQYAFDAFWS